MSRQQRSSVAAATVVIVAAIGTDLLVSACGEGPTGPSEPPRLTVTISESGPNPVTVRGPREGAFTVEFVNQDSQPHEVRSDPHPEHNNCPALDRVGVIAPGQSVVTADLQGCFVIIGRFTDRLTYHDDARLDDPRFQGTVQR
jgi:hypothetical protein